MANQDSGGDKTENATPKRLREARKRGDVPKSRDLTNTLGLAFTLALFALALGGSIERLAAFTLDALASPERDFPVALGEIGGEGIALFLTLSATILLPIAAFGMLVDFLQTGPRARPSRRSSRTSRTSAPSPASSACSASTTSSRC